MEREKPFKCLFCNLHLATVKHYVSHQEVHSGGKNFSFPCAFDGCRVTLQSLAAFKTHLTRFHKTTQSEPTVHELVKTSIECCVPSCKIPLVSRKQYMSHSNFHILQGETIQCAWCEKSFSKTKPFRVHVSAFHQGLVLPSSEVRSSEGLVQCRPSNIDSDPQAGPSSAVDVESSVDFELDDNDGSEGDFEAQFPDDDIYPIHLVKQQIAKFYLMLEGSLLLASSTVQQISAEVGLLSRMSHHCLKRALTAELKLLDLSDAQISSCIANVFKSDPVYSVHMKGEDLDDMSSQFLRMKYMKQNFPMVEAKEISLGVNVKTGKIRKSHYVPLKPMLEAALRDSRLKKEVQKSFFTKEEKCSDVLEDYTDGQVFKEHKQQCPDKCIQLIFFQDAFEFFPFGPAHSLYKTIGVYFSIGNLPPEYRSKVDMVFCCGLILESDLKAVGYELAFDCIIKDLSQLNVNGIDIDGEKVKVCMMFMTGDNLGAHQIGGFVEGFSKSQYFCRFCEISREEFHKCPYKCKPLRTVSSYDSNAKAAQICSKEHERQKKKKREKRLARRKASKPHLKRSAQYMKLKEPERLSMLGNKKPGSTGKKSKKQPKKSPWKTFKANKSHPEVSVKGVKQSSSVLNKVPGFHVCNPGLPPCLAHDLFEKIVNVILGQILYHFIEELKWFSFEVLNRRIGSFKTQGSDKLDAPTPIKSYGQVGGHASETWSLLRLLPFIIGDLVQDPSDCMWQLYLLLKSICEFVCAPRISKEQVCYLKILIERFLDVVSKICPDSLVPKMHYLSHYPDLIVTFGPLIRLWTMRYESKHSFFKTVGRVCRNFINITYTLTRKNQLRFAYDHCGGFIGPNVSYNAKNCRPVTEFQLPCAWIAALENYDISMDSYFLSDQLVIKGTTYAEGMWLITGVMDSNLLVGCVDLMLVCGTEVLFLLKEELATNSFLGYYALEDRLNIKYVCKHLNELLDFYPLCAYQLNNSMCISLKYSVLGM